MNFELTDDQQMIKALVERFVSEQYAPGQRAVHRAHAAGYSPANWALLAELGILALPFDAADGGLDGGPVEIATIMEVLGRALAVEPVLAEIVLAGGILAAAGTDAQKAAWIAPIIAGERHLDFAFAEHGSRWRLDRPATRFADGLLTGGKTFAAAHADGHVVTATDGVQAGLYLVERGAAGLSTRTYRRIDGAMAAEIRFDGTPATPLAHPLAAAAPVLDRARLAATAEMLGIMGYMFDTTLDYVRQRRQFGAPIGSFQAVQHRLADLYAGVEQARSLLLRATLADQADRPAAIAAAKAYVSTTALRVGEESVQMHGGMGVSEELDIGTALKRLLLLTTLFGDADHETARYNALIGSAG